MKVSVVVAFGKILFYLLLLCLCFFCLLFTFLSVLYALVSIAFEALLAIAGKATRHVSTFL